MGQRLEHEHARGLGHGLAVLLRGLQIAGIFFAAALRYLGQRLLSALRGRRAQSRAHIRGAVMAWAFQQLGATFIKLGQVLSTRPDLFGPEYTQALAKLQDQVAPISLATVERVLAQELGPRRDQITIEPAPLAAASVAQVHRGVLQSGERVAIKVQRPRARTQVTRDLALMKIAGNVINCLPSMKLLSIPGAVERFSAVMQQQLDFELEAANNRRFAKNFEAMEGVRVPTLYPALCTKRVLTMELIEGISAARAAEVSGDRAGLARRGLAMIHQMVFQDGFVHADLHPGNIFFTAPSEGRGAEIVLLDLGLVAEIEPAMMSPFIQTFGAMATYDGARAAALFYGYAPAVKPGVDYAAYEAELIAQFDALKGKAFEDLEAAKILGGMLDVLRRYGVRVDPVFTVVHIAVLVAEGLGKQLDPSMDLLSESAPYIANALMKAPPAAPMLRAIPAHAPAGAIAA